MESRKPEFEVPDLENIASHSIHRQKSNEDYPELWDIDCQIHVKHQENFR